MQTEKSLYVDNDAIKPVFTVHYKKTIAIGHHVTAAARQMGGIKQVRQERQAVGLFNIHGSAGCRVQHGITPVIT